MKKINFDKIKKKNLIDKEKLKFKKKTVKPKKKTEKKTKHVGRKIWTILLSIVVVLAIIGVIAGVLFCAYIVKTAPEFNPENMFEKESTRIFDSKGNLYATLGTEQRQKVTYDELPQVLIDAIIATEDSRFFQHNGFDAPRFIKASISQVLGRGGGGASTLTMQLSKLAFTSTESTGIQGIIRKFTDIYMAVFKMEQYYTKQEIIEYYVNTPCMGGNIYGVQQASQHYFGKDVKDLNLVEAAQIAGMFQSPNGYNPYVNPNDANARKNTVLYLMQRHGYITEEEYKAASSVKIADMLAPEATSTSNPYQGFIDTIVEEVIEKTGNDPYVVPMDIYSTMVTSKQDVINKFYKTYKFKDKKIEVGIGVIDNKTGAIIAVGAGRYKNNARTLNMATFHGQTLRMPGSTIKPIMDYGPAFEYANLSTYGPFIDEPTKYGSGTMRNFGGGNKGFMTAKDCLRKSINTCALQAFRLTTAKQKYNFVTSLGIELESEFIPDSYSIGAANLVSPVSLASAYSTFGNGGYYTKPYSFTKLVYRDTNEEYKQEINRKRVMKPQTAYLVSSILVNVTNYRVKVSGTQIATKTGTSSYDAAQLRKYKLGNNIIPDSWTSSYSPDYAIAIWYGYTTWLNDETVKNRWYLNNNSASTERHKIMAAVVNNIYEKNSKFKNPGGLVSAKVELETIPPEAPSANTPSDLIGTFLFISGTEPTSTSSRFSTLQNPTNVTYSVSGNSIYTSWSPISTPSAIDTNYLWQYFENGYGEFAEKYYNSRIKYNSSKIGTLGYQIYLTSGVNSTYVGWTDQTSYTIDTSKYSGTFDGFIIKSCYSKFTKNASSGVKILLAGMSEETISSSDVTINMSNLNITYEKGATFRELNKNDITSILYKGEDIKTNVSSLSVITSSSTVPTNDITSKTGTYSVTYSISFRYNNTPITKTVTQTVKVN